MDGKPNQWNLQEKLVAMVTPPEADWVLQDTARLSVVSLTMLLLLLLLPRFSRHCLACFRDPGLKQESKRARLDPGKSCCECTKSFCKTRLNRLAMEVTRTETQKTEVEVWLGNSSNEELPLIFYLEKKPIKLRIASESRRNHKVLNDTWKTSRCLWCLWCLWSLVLGSMSCTVAYQLAKGASPSKESPKRSKLKSLGT